MLPNPAGMLARVTDETHDPTADALRAQILDLVREYHQAAFPPADFVPGASAVPVSGRVFDDDDLVKLVDSSLDFWLTTGRYAHEFERGFAKRMGVRHCLLVNSGSSANLVEVSRCRATHPLPLPLTLSSAPQEVSNSRTLAMASSMRSTA
jgi:hypothetical protein